MTAAARAALAHRADTLDPAIEDALRRLVLAYAVAVDFGLYDDAGELFVSDAAWDGTEFGFGRHEGRGAIAAALRTQCEDATAIVHNAAPPLVWTCGPNTAAGLSYFSALRRDAEGVSKQAFGVYDDDYVREPSDGVWRISSRRLHFRLVGR